MKYKNPLPLSPGKGFIIEYIAIPTHTNIIAYTPI